MGSAALFALQDLVLLGLVLASAGGPPGAVNAGLMDAYIFFADLATAYWFGILLLVAAGYWCALHTGGRRGGGGGWQHVFGVRCT